MKRHTLRCRLGLLPVAMLFACGSVDEGDAGPANDNSSVPSDTLGASPVAKIVAGGRFTCALKVDESVWCWGDNEYNQLGQPGEPLVPIPALVPGLGGVRDLAVGFDHACGLKHDGALWCWGSNAQYQLGTETPSEIPAVVPELPTATAVASGGDHVCVVLSDRSHRCWGANEYGQSSSPLGTALHIPLPISGFEGSIQQISAGYAHTCLVKDDDTVWCVGRNDGFELGIADPAIHVVQLPTPASAIALLQPGFHSTCMVKTDETLWCWGQPLALGDGSPTDRRVSEPVLLSAVQTPISIGLGWYHSCAVSAGTVYCWGENEVGQLGGGAVPLQLLPTLVPGLTDISQVTSGQYHSCALKNDGTVFCWGSNEQGQLGDGTVENRFTPVQVVFP